MQREHTGKYISFLLRHKPEAAGLSLDEHGWANVEELIACVSRSRFLDRPFLDEIVALDNKQRYSFSADGTKIRVNQGHSRPVDVNLECKVPPEYLWHGTAVKYLDSILKTGLQRRTRLHVHLTCRYDTAVATGRRHGTPVVLRISSGAMHRDGYLFYLSANDVWLTEQVPVKYLEIHSDP